MESARDKIFERLESSPYTPISYDELDKIYQEYINSDEFSIENYLLKHPNQEYVRRACIHYLGDSI